MTTSVQYSPRAARAIGFLKTPYNDIEVYVEDTAGQTMWTRLLSKALPDGLRLTSVTMLGGRDKVVAACELDQRNDGRRKLYIIDGDFDFLCRIPKPRLRHLYRLRAYCVENLLLSPQSIIEVATDCSESTPSNVSSQFNFAQFVANSFSVLKPLFIVYALAEKLRSGIQTVSFNVLQLTKSINGIPTLSTKKVLSRIRSIMKQLVIRFGFQQVCMERRQISVRADTLDFRTAISGKDYLLPLIWQNLRRHFGYTGSHGQLKVHLAKEYMVISEPYLSRRLRQIANS